MAMTNSGRFSIWFNKNVSRELISRGLMYLRLMVTHNGLSFVFSGDGRYGKDKCTIKNHGTQVAFGRKWMMPYVYVAAGDKACYNHITFLLARESECGGDVCYCVQKVIDYSNQKYKSSYASLQGVLNVRAQNSKLMRHMADKHERDERDDEASYQHRLMEDLKNKYNTNY